MHMSGVRVWCVCEVCVWCGGGIGCVVRCTCTTDAENQTEDATLNSVYCVSADDCWGVGDVFDSNIYIVHWDGATWSPIPPAQNNVSSADAVPLRGVYCPATDDCWAVNAPISDRPSILHWNGSNWAKEDDIDNFFTNMGINSPLASITCTSADNCWAVGEKHEPEPSFGDRGSILHYTGASNNWDYMDTFTNLAPESANLTDVSCVDADHCYAVGEKKGDFFTIVSYNPNTTTWEDKSVDYTTVSDPMLELGGALDLNAIKCYSATDCWVGGAKGTYPVVMRGDPDTQTWTIAPGDTNFFPKEPFEKLSIPHFPNDGSGGSTQTTIHHWFEDFGTPS